MVGESRNVYLSASVVVGSENIFYSRNIDASFNIVDSSNLKHCENCYENMEGVRNYNSQYLFLCRNCVDSFYSVDCVNCSNCFLSYNLRNKKFCIKNKQYSKEDYFKELNKINLKSRKSRDFLRQEFNSVKKKAIYRYANIINSQNSTGHNILNAKNFINCFDAYDGENFKYCYRAFTSKDCMDYDYGQTSELMYEYITGAMSDYNIRFSYTANNAKDAEYTDFCISSTNLFGCISVRNNKNVILNKIYTKEEFTKLREKIIKHMDEMPYADKGGRIYRYGEFFPMEISPFSYNETQAQDFQFLSKEEAEKLSYPYKNEEIKNPKVTIRAEDITDDISEVNDSIFNETISCRDEGGCHHKCTIAFIITKGELEFYKKNNIPLPDKCPNCRNYERFAQIPLPKLYHRKCMNEGCSNEFETPYAPDRPEKVYCEQCYNKEVY